MRRQPGERDLVVDDAGDGEVADGVGVDRLEGDVRLARQSVGYRVDLNNEEGKSNLLKSYCVEPFKIVLSQL